MADEKDSAPNVVRRAGRPREVENPIRIDIRVSASQYDRLYKVAAARGVSVPAVIRQAISAVETPNG